jgi:hypothetical protein
MWVATFVESQPRKQDVKQLRIPIVVLHAFLFNLSAEETSHE